MTKAFLLGAGLGTRLRPLTNTTPKPLVPVFHRPLATHALDHLISAGISEVAINTHHLHEEWQKTFPDSTYRGARLHFYHEADLLETGGGIKNIADFISGESILIYNGDILTNIRIDKLITGHLASNNVATLAVRAEGPGKHIALDGRRIIDIRKMLGIAEGSHQFTGIYCIDPEILDLIPANEKVSIILAFLELAKQGQLGAYHADPGHWLDLGTRDAYLETHGIGGEIPCPLDTPPIHPEAEIAPSATVTNSWVGPGCVIGDQVTLTDCILWPGTRVAPSSRLERCIVHSPKLIEGQHLDSDL
ncbi:MAG: sugar phosphate nucleotidyltransferase [Verrucomicrobiota bacterium JB023]|nr:sugar phosphate nucleotidyltransferase [Verrucomicrobiota bacterium JB023]